jgi:hypothetical protein
MRVLVFVVGAALAACTVPSVPVPPPTPEGMAFIVDTAAGTAQFSANLGPSWAYAWVIVKDEDSGEGVAERAGDDGRIGPTRPFAAQLGDQIFVSFELEDQSSGICLVLRDGQLSSNDRCF